MIALKEAGYEDVAESELEGSVVVLYANGEEYAPMKIVNKYAKEFAADKESNTSVKFLGGWYDKKWHNAEYVNELANIPSREELLSKLARLYLGVHYPGDILVGLTWGFLVGSFVYYLFYRATRKQSSVNHRFISSKFTSMGYLRADCDIPVSILVFTLLYALIRACIF
jgi:hypothetical protein